jgi:hypothetical protein
MTSTTGEKNKPENKPEGRDGAARPQKVPAPVAPMPREKQPDEGDFAEEAGPLETEFGTKEDAASVVSKDFHGD